MDVFTKKNDIQIQKFRPGMIFRITDDPINHPYTSHPYMIISNMNEYGKQIQCMGITSCTAKDIDGTVPVVLDNTISFVNPFNLYSFTISNFDLNNYAGMISTDDKAFKLAIKIYYYTILDNSQNEKVLKDLSREYNNYMTQFNKENENRKYYRDILKSNDYKNINTEESLNPGIKKTDIVLDDYLGYRSTK